MNEKTDLMQGWPADPENPELLRLAEQIQAAAAPLPAEALARVEQQMRAEIEMQARQQRRRRLAWRFSAAAAVLIALGVGAYFRTRPTDSPPFAQPNRHVEPALVEDRIKVAVGGVGNAVAVEKPLLRLDDYESLFTNQ